MKHNATDAGLSSHVVVETALRHDREFESLLKNLGKLRRRGISFRKLARIAKESGHSISASTLLRRFREAGIEPSQGRVVSKNRKRRRGPAKGDEHGS
jgi:hypothetical protein